MNPAQQREVVMWACQCASRVAELADARATAALAVLQRWLNDDLPLEQLREAALDAHRAAASADADSARLASRACAQAVGAALRVQRAPHAASYARRAISAAGGNADDELAWQRSIANDTVKDFLAAQVAPHASSEDSA